MKTPFHLLGLLAILTFSWSCSFVAPSPSRSPTPLPSLEAVRLSNETIRSLRGVANIELLYQGKWLKTRVAIALAEPGLMRLETLNFLDQPLLILTADGVALQAFSLPENRFYRGTVSEGLTHFMNLRIGSEAFVSLILGKIPTTGDGSIRYDSNRGLYQVTFPPSIRWRMQTFWIHPRTLRVVEITKRDALTGKEIRIWFSRVRKVQSVDFPMGIEIGITEVNSLIKLRFRTLEINPSFAPDLFRLTIPPGVEVVELNQAIKRPPSALETEE